MSLASGLVDRLERIINQECSNACIHIVVIRDDGTLMIDDDTLMPP